MTAKHNNERLIEAKPGQPRTLIFSQRNLTQIQPYRCAHFEFEDVIAEVDHAVILSPRIDSSTWRYPLARQLAYHTPIRLNPGVERLSLQSDFDLFFAICGGPPDLLRIQAISNWRARCKKAICLIDEVWVREVRNYRNYLRMLRDFDLVVLYYSQSVGPVDEMMGEKKCTFLPPGVDTIRFCPYPNPPKRVIDIYSIGRRSAVTHKAFLGMAAKDGMFYLHDSTSADQVLNPIEHRSLFANVAKRSRYFIVNPGLIDRPEVRGNQLEIGNRYFEAAASGNILLGERTRNGEFEKFFDWPDALIDLSYDAPDAERIVKECDQQPERQAAIRKVNIQQSLLRHDWVYRWEQMLKMVDVAPLPQLNSRKERLRRLAEHVGEDQGVGTAMGSAYGEEVLA
jgi:glycosyltransferase involved in cell wall biosynthesis